MISRGLGRILSKRRFQPDDVFFTMIGIDTITITITTIDNNRYPGGSRERLVSTLVLPSFSSRQHLI
ncbi:hypothetical protein HZH66_006041 [Vespula vulgaris]|uniref:Uncharacterized protein n=1 Tax=Vespula vulgaris TaxID=7454 RepID=A0A834K7L0_VESVU|nr:hypothetical protein HZH66_006041 [Vespula vulgaris]